MPTNPTETDRFTGKGGESSDTPLTPGDRNLPFVTIDDERHYVVTDLDRMPPFLMAIVSDTDQWMFLSSTGAVTAGRRTAATALFPYETDDRLHRLGGLNGPATAIRIVGADVDDIWRPVADRPTATRRRALYKSVAGDAVVFEEHDETSGLTFRYRWASSDRFGFVRTAVLTNHGTARRHIEVVDGLRNILPHGLDPNLYLPMSNLTNAYKRSELIDSDLRLAVYSLESLLTDKAEPSQALRSTTVWSVGLEGSSVSLHPDATERLDDGAIASDRLVTGMPGAYFLRSTILLDPGESEGWSIVADVGLDQPAVASLIRDLDRMPTKDRALSESIRRGTLSLTEIMARADALQCTGDEIATAHHVSNVTYNVMRGGIPMDGYAVETG